MLKKRNVITIKLLLIMKIKNILTLTLDLTSETLLFNSWLYYRHYIY